MIQNKVGTCQFILWIFFSGLGLFWTFAHHNVFKIILLRTSVWPAGEDCLDGLVRLPGKNFIQLKWYLLHCQQYCHKNKFYKKSFISNIFRKLRCRKQKIVWLKVHWSSWQVMGSSTVEVSYALDLLTYTACAPYCCCNCCNHATYQPNPNFIEYDIVVIDTNPWD